MFLSIGFFVHTVRYVLEQIGLNPILECPFLHAQFRGNNQALGCGELNRKL